MEDISKPLCKVSTMGYQKARHPFRENVVLKTVEMEGDNPQRNIAHCYKFLLHSAEIDWSFGKGNISQGCIAHINKVYLKPTIFEGEKTYDVILRENGEVFSSNGKHTVIMMSPEVLFSTKDSHGQKHAYCLFDKNVNEEGYNAFGETKIFEIHEEETVVDSVYVAEEVSLSQYDELLWIFNKARACEKTKDLLSLDHLFSFYENE